MKELWVITKLKSEWERDPTWDIEDTEGFEQYRDELRDYRLKCEAEWKLIAEDRDRNLDDEARELGVEGLLRIIKRLEERIGVLEGEGSRQEWDR